ncbi:MAG: hypothetical protein ACI9XC_002236 [Gammaproteobacteria bacterium]|jgi:hypothetical protein
MKSQVDKLPAKKNDINSFLKKVRDVKSMTTYGNKPGRLAFIIDATASRQPTWDSANRIQAKMFKAVEDVGKLHVQLIYFRGVLEFYASKWYADSNSLSIEMKEVSCLAGHTQIERSLKELLSETNRKQVSAAVFVGDAFEETTSAIYNIAGQLGIRKIPVFMFQENYQADVEKVYRNIAKLSGGAYCRFDNNSADLLAQLLSAVAIYAAGGHQALRAFAKNSNPQLQEMTRQLLK